jgi:hypothetical protein
MSYLGIVIYLFIYFDRERQELCLCIIEEGK